MYKTILYEVKDHIATAPLANQAAQENAFELYSLPQGIISKLYRDAAAQGPGVFSQIGLGTYMDPEQHGGKLNAKAKASEDLVQPIELQGEKWLHYQTLPINVAFIKASYADENGNLSIKRNSTSLEFLSLAMAAHNAGGVVIAQVEEVVKAHTLPAREVVVPGMLVDYIVVNEDEKYHMQTAGTHYSPALSNEIRIELTESHYGNPLTSKKALTRRAALEIPKDAIVNLGNGLASKVGEIIAEGQVLEHFNLTTDLGNVGGMPVTGIDYGPSYNADAVINSEDMFSLYHGGGLDVAVLGFGQMDATGNMNTTKLGNYIVGPGGMMDIAAGAKKVIFVGSFVVKGQNTVKNGEVVITEEGVAPKFMTELPYITFSTKLALEKGKEILVITDRAVFDFDKQGKLRLIEIAPGLDLQKDILNWMDFEPVIADDLKVMNSHLYQEDWSLVKHHPSFTS